MCNKKKPMGCPQAVPILTYHHVNPLEGDMITVSVNHFEAQMAFLQRSGYHTLFVSELVNWMQGENPIPKKSLVLTFDDGFRDNYEFAFPVLKKYGIKATLFIVSGWISGERPPVKSGEVIPHHQCNQLIAQGRGDQIAMTWPEVQELQDSGLVEIESHTNTHNKKLYQDASALKEDLNRSREVIADHLKKNSTCLCWPGGGYNRESINAARGAGFTALCTTERGLNQPGGDLSQLKRVTVRDAGSWWLWKTIFLFSHPLWGRLYAKIKPT
jgi:peptidoglycan/xylan/chitin deacetylase (PgdA/CDA1 family)